jgi:hypothetical protein
MKKALYAITAVLSTLFFIGCDNTISKKNDLGIVAGKIDSYFYKDTSFADKKIMFYPKFNRDSIYFRPYNIGFEYVKEYDEKEAKWKLTFGVAQYDKYVSVYPTKGILKIDDYEINYESVMTSEIGPNKSTLFVYGTFNKIKESEIINKIALAKIVKFIALGHDKQEFIWSPKIVEDAKNTLKYFDSLKTTSPAFK